MNFTRHTLWAGLLLCAILLCNQSAFAQDERVFDNVKEAETAERIPEVADKPLPVGDAAGPGDVITRFEVRGTRRVEPDSIFGQLRSKVGNAIDLDIISDDIKRVFKLGYFDDVQVDATKTTNGDVIVTFIVREKPAIVKIEYKGNDELSLDDIQDVVNLRLNQVLNESEVKANSEKIRELYAEKGYFLAEVDYAIKVDEKNPFEADVTFNINEFSKVEVKKITFLGNKVISDEELKNIMATREGDWGSFLTQFGSFKEEAFETDLRRITAYYYDKGHVQVQVQRPTLRLSRDKKYIFITIGIEEGPEFKTGDIEIQGDLIVAKEKLEEKVTIKKGEVFSYGQMRLNAEEMRDIYMDRGYAYVNVNPLSRPRQNGELIVDVVFDIQKGSKVYFGRIDVVGNRTSRDKIIRRELTIREGDLFSNAALEKSKTKVRRLGLFEKVEITTQRGDRDDIINARVEVTERPTGTFQFGFGLSSFENWIINGSISENNFFGRGQSLNFQAQFSTLRSIFNFSFSEPWFFDTRWQFSAELFNFDFALQDFERRSRGGNLSFGYPITDEVSLTATYKLEDVRLRPGGRSNRSTAQVGNLFRGGLTSSLRLRAAYDDRDNRLFPTKGRYVTASAELADDNLTLSQNEFLKYDVEARQHFPIFWKFVLTLKGELGYVQSVDARKPVPLFERYFVGGPNTTRGFERFSLGPARNVADNTADPGSDLDIFRIGGNKQLFFTAEVEFPILTAIGFKGVIFADAGNAFDNDQNYALRLDLFTDDENDYRNALRTAVGFGFRWLSPIGPLRFEWGIPLARLRNEDPLVFDFSIINSF